jgi:hypothetical protein
MTTIGIDCATQAKKSGLAHGLFENGKARIENVTTESNGSPLFDTLDVYGHLIPVMQEEAARIMDEKVTPIPLEIGGKLEMEPLSKK